MVTMERTPVNQIKSNQIYLPYVQYTI